MKENMTKVRADDYEKYLSERIAQNNESIQEFYRIRTEQTLEDAKFKKKHPIKSFFGFHPQTYIPRVDLTMLSFRAKECAQNIEHLENEFIRLEYVRQHSSTIDVSDSSDFFLWYKIQYL